MLPQQQIPMSTTHEIFFVGVVAISHFMTQAGVGQALAPIGIIGESFGTQNPGELAWFIAGYALTVGTFILIGGRLGDILGHKRMFTFGYAWFGMWSGYAGFAAYPRNQIFFDFARAMQGIGPALLMPNGMALLGRAYPPGIKKNIVFSIFGGVAPGGFVVGALSGSLFGQLLFWPWAFWSFGIGCFLLAALSLVVIPKPLSERPVHRMGFDWTGSFTGVSGLVLVNVAWNNGPLYGWGTPHVYFLLIIGLLCLVAFAWVESRAVNPLVPMHALSGTTGYVLALVALGWGAFGIWVHFTFRFLEVVRGATPLSSVAQFAPAPIAGLVAAGLTGFLLTHTPVSFTMLVSMIAFFLGITLAGTMPAQQVYWAQMFISVVVMPFGMDMSFPAASIILSNNMPREHQGLAGSLCSTVVNYSISLALGIAGTVETSVVGHDGGHDPDTIEQGFRAAYYTGIALAAMGVCLGALFFVRTLLKEGWKVMEH
ncbi:YOR378W-like protein [Lineolata rhizophorae]|uniref:YOR378W-like protein n=1 Tax=Lineolata rhizophorae TaxID=578093 RepID=A0A6A6NNU8_9PEZI|nr:YOR378W-like protein [Lineolata rhizophorae]